jgi:manganese efflux pump family protein
MFLDLLLFSFILSIDSFSAALALGFRHFSARRALFFALSSGFSEGLATALGFLLGRLAQNLIAAYDHWVAFILLSLVGGHMCYHAYQELRGRPESNAEKPDAKALKVHGPWKILFVATVTSLDSLGVGISLGLVDKPVTLYALAIGIGAFCATYAGLFLAKKFSAQFGEKIEFLGGIILILIGIQMLKI